MRALPGGAQLAILAERARTSQERRRSRLPEPARSGASPSRSEAAPLLDGANLRRDRARAARAALDRSAALDFEALAAGLAHEIKNPLAGLQGSAELLAREAEGAAREYAR